MLLLFIGLIVIGLINLGFYCFNNKDSVGGCMLVLLLSMTLVFLLIVSSFTAYDIQGGKVIEAEITMLEEENEKFEEKMAAVVTDYMKHESETFEKATINSETLTFYVAKYPELKSDSLVNSQIEAYTKNKTQIVNLKKELLNIPRLKWLLYFGH